jgi:hypothetical protein
MDKGKDTDMGKTGEDEIKYKNNIDIETTFRNK